MTTEAKPKLGLDRSKTGRRKGTPNKTTALLKDAILRAAERAGGPESENSPGGIVGYLEGQAKTNPGPFIALLGKVLPLQVTGSDGGPVQVSVVKFTEIDDAK
jgi:hypothetical protein